MFIDADCEIELRFNASHILYFNNIREELHGHNYIIEVKLKCEESKEVNEELASALKKFCSTINNKIIIADRSPFIVPSEVENSIRVTLPDRKYYQFPKKCCYSIPEISSSSENICRHIYEVIKDSLNDD